MTIDETIKNLLHKLGAVRIEHPMFYSFPVGIRFEIGIGDVYDDADNPLPTYVNDALNRVYQIFQQVFKGSPDILLFKAFFASERQAQDFIRRFCNEAAELDSITSDDDEDGPWLLTPGEFVKRFRNEITDVPPHEIAIDVANCDGEPMWHLSFYWDLSRSHIDLTKLFRAIILAEIGGGMYPLTSATYLYGIERNILFHLYDHRGLDVVAADCKSLLPTYEQFNLWILDYDREQIDAVFHSCGSAGQ